ncbi:MAG: SHOCT domain-containing protein [Lachnospiraceae bacterium]|nr:SHOCT domain-containing protein [Lachnospiraceae bacterium]
MFGKPEIIESFYGEYKIGLLGKKNRVSLYVYEKMIDGTGAEYFAGKLVEHSFEIKYEQIKKIEEKYIEGNRCLLIEYLDTNTVVKNKIVTVALPCLEKMEDAKKLLFELKEKSESEQKKKQDEERAAQEQQLLEQKRYEEECQLFFKDCYNFHIADNNNPYYELQSDTLQFAGIYIDKSKNLNFLKIDAYNQDESNACIPYEKIHYYEKAGSVHYTTNINGNYTSFGGSFTGATVSKAASVIGGLLFGPMGMATGALLTHKPMKMETPTIDFNISSEDHRIDDRSVVLNYYSDKKQQFIDIELPSDIYNFLQTYLPERKYGIVLELEKKNAVKEYEENNTLAIQGHEMKKLEINVDDTEQFEKRIKKLKIMYDNGILSEEEFIEEKKRILSEL